MRGKDWSQPPLGPDTTEYERALRLYEVLSRVNESIVRAHDQQALFDEVCKIITEVGGFPLAWIGLVQGRKVVPVSRGGPASDYVDNLEIEVDGRLGAGPSGTSIREGRPVINEDFDVNPKTAPWRTAALKWGFRASASFPLRCEGKVIGSLTLYSIRPAAFDQPQIKLLDSLSSDLSYALDAFEHERRRKEAEDALRVSETRMRLLSETAGRLLGSEDPQGLVEELCRRVMSHLDCDAFFNFLVDESAGKLRLNACAGVSKKEAESIEWLDYGIAICGCAARDRQRIVAEDIQHSSDPRAALVRSYGIQAYCAHPLMAEGKLLGTLSFGTKSRPTFTAADVELMRSVADHVATAMQRIRAKQALSTANAQLLEADRHKNNFLAVLSHELRNPLAPITNSLYVLDHVPPGGEQASRAKQVIARQVGQLSSLVNDLLDVTRITRNKIQLQKERLELNELARRTIEDNRSLFDKAGVSLELLPTLSPVYVIADRTRMAQVIGNLLQNAAKFTCRGGRTQVMVAAHDSEALVRVRDDGVGLSPEIQARLFEPFMQAEQTLDRSKGGLGLGLALVRGLVELHGGKVSVHSEGPGKGTEFTVRLPLGCEASLEAAGARSSSSHAGRRVLIIEDNVDAADSLRDVLVLANHAVEVAYSGPDGLAKARAHRPEIVFCDIGLPGMDGYQVARAFRADRALKNAYLVALSGYAQAEDLQRAAEAGFRRHLPKPPSIEKLEELLSSAETEIRPQTDT